VKSPSRGASGAAQATEERARGVFPAAVLPVVRDGRKTYDVRGTVGASALFSNIGTEERT
jgi:hypothetical protein